MRSRYWFSAAAAAFAVLASPSLASAQSCGWTGLHDFVRKGKLTCFVDHYHFGAGKGATRKAAEADAARAWAEFVAWEYCAAWARWNNAQSKSMACEQSGSGWSCSASAIPCTSRSKK